MISRFFFLFGREVMADRQCRTKAPDTNGAVIATPTNGTEPGHRQHVAWCLAGARQLSGRRASAMRSSGSSPSVLRSLPTRSISWRILERRDMRRPAALLCRRMAQRAAGRGRSPCQPNHRVDVRYLVHNRQARQVAGRDREEPDLPSMVCLEGRIDLALFRPKQVKVAEAGCRRLAGRRISCEPGDQAWTL